MVRFDEKLKIFSTTKHIKTIYGGVQLQFQMYTDKIPFAKLQ